MTQIAPHCTSVSLVGTRANVNPQKRNCVSTEKSKNGKMCDRGDSIQWIRQESDPDYQSPRRLLEEELRVTAVTIPRAARMLRRIPKSIPRDAGTNKRIVMIVMVIIEALTVNLV